ncbi:WD40-repeat-containing domain protein [Lipomyces japonicus]|uniref:WD40-repeat-containing domain protein n=1 Tax=Lipomyces japonicus TaxID=56871 RepID=UPI0034CEA6A7
MCGDKPAYEKQKKKHTHTQSETRPAMEPFVTGHADLIHDVAYDYYGRHLATCSSDQHIRVFGKSPDSVSWQLQSIFKAHDAQVFSISFAPPQYGLLIASASSDQNVRLHVSDDDGVTFKRIANLADSNGSVTNVSFAKHLSHGLKLACIGTDGVARVYHAADPSDLKLWHLAFEQRVDDAAQVGRDLQGDFALDWCPAGFLAVPVFEDGTGVVNGNEDQDDDELPRVDRLAIQEKQVEQFVASAGTTAVVFRKQQDVGPYAFEPKERLDGHGDIIHDVAWALNARVNGRYELIATACKDGFVRIYQLSLKRPASKNGDDSDDVGYDVRLLNQFDDHKNEVWKVSWNSDGTILSSSGDDGYVRFWKQSYKGEFVCIKAVSSEPSNGDE